MTPLAWHCGVAAICVPLLLLHRPRGRSLSLSLLLSFFPSFSLAARVLSAFPGRAGHSIGLGFSRVGVKLPTGARGPRHRKSALVRSTRVVVVVVGVVVG